MSRRPRTLGPRDPGPGGTGPPRGRHGATLAAGPAWPGLDRTVTAVGSAIRADEPSRLCRRPRRPALARTAVASLRVGAGRAAMRAPCHAAPRPATRAFADCVIAERRRAGSVQSAGGLSRGLSLPRRDGLLLTALGLPRRTLGQGARAITAAWSLPRWSLPRRGCSAVLGTCRPTLVRTHRQLHSSAPYHF